MVLFVLVLVAAVFPLLIRLLSVLFVAAVDGGVGVAVEPPVFGVYSSYRASLRGEPFDMGGSAGYEVVHPWRYDSPGPTNDG